VPDRRRVEVTAREEVPELEQITAVGLQGVARQAALELQVGEEVEHVVLERACFDVSWGDGHALCFAAGRLVLADARRRATVRLLLAVRSLVGRRNAYLPIEYLHITQTRRRTHAGQEGKTEGPGTKTPDQAYKEGRSEDVQEGSLGVDIGGAGAQKSRLPEKSDGTGTAHAGGFAGQEADDPPDAGTVGDISGGGDPSPHAQYDQTKAEQSSTGASATDVGEGAKDPASGTLGTDGPDDVGDRGIGQQRDYHATDTDEKQDHPKNPSDMGSR